MIEVDFTLRTDGGDSLHAKLPHLEQLPRTGELVEFEARTYQVIAVLWHPDQAGTRVTVTACERSWQEHIAAVEARWHTCTDACDTSTGLAPRRRPAVRQAIG